MPVCLRNRIELIRGRPWRLTKTCKARHRMRLKRVDSVIEAIQESGVQTSSLQKALELPKEWEMLPRDKYSVFSTNPQHPNFRKPIHWIPHWTKVTQRLNPKGF